MSTWLLAEQPSDVTRHILDSLSPENKGHLTGGGTVERNRKHAPKSARDLNSEAKS